MKSTLADYVTIMADVIQNNLKVWNEELTKDNMKLNVNKTKVMVITEKEEEINTHQ